MRGTGPGAGTPVERGRGEGAAGEGAGMGCERLAKQVRRTVRGVQRAGGYACSAAQRSSISASCRRFVLWLLG